MVSGALSSVSLLIGALLLSVALAQYFRSRNHPPYPPGPRALPIIGNLYDLPSTNVGKAYSEWSRLYGENLVHLQVFGYHTIVVNSRKLANELFDTRSRIYSDRPYIPMIDLLGWREVGLGFMPYGNKWRRQRRLFQEGFRHSAATDLLPIQARKVDQFLVNLLNQPGKFRAHIRTLAAATIMGVMYGHDVAPSNDYFVQLAERANDALLNLSTPTAMFVNVFPALRHLPGWFPGCGFQQISRQSREWVADMVHKPYSLVIDEINSGSRKPSLLSKFLERRRTEDDEEELDIKHVCASAYGAGADTTVAAIGTFLIAMATHPEVQEKAQEELDRVVGQHRLPTYDDRPGLPYLECIYREILRWRVITPLSVPHATIASDVVNGYFIPEGATVIGNTWAMTRDEDVYPDPETFLPERYMKEDGTCNDDDVSFIFGFGRRICPGRHLASATIWGAMASVLAAYNVTKAKDGAGNEIEIDAAYSDGLVSHPGEFSCAVTPRSENARGLVSDLAP